MSLLREEGRHEKSEYWGLKPVGTLNYVYRKLCRLFHQSDIMLWLISHPFELGISMFCSCFIWLSPLLSHVIWGPRNPTESRKQVKILKIFRGSAPDPAEGLHRPQAPSWFGLAPLAFACFSPIKIWHALVQFYNAPLSRQSWLRHWHSFWTRYFQIFLDIVSGRDILRFFWT